MKIILISSLLILSLMSNTYGQTGMEQWSFLVGEFECTSKGSDGKERSNKQSNTWLYDKKGMKLEASTETYAVVGLAAWDVSRKEFRLANVDTFGDLILYQGTIESDTITISNLESRTAPINGKTGYPWLLKFKAYKIDETSYGLTTYNLGTMAQGWQVSQTSICKTIN